MYATRNVAFFRLFLGLRTKMFKVGFDPLRYASSSADRLNLSCIILRILLLVLLNCLPSPFSILFSCELPRFDYMVRWPMDEIRLLVGSNWRSSDRGIFSFSFLVVDAYFRFWWTGVDQVIANVYNFIYQSFRNASIISDTQWPTLDVLSPFTNPPAKKTINICLNDRFKDNSTSLGFTKNLFN